ncbi:transporter [Alkalihalobacillus alcalophilus ATCC 27647 = CGMCC 1.3604]|uniref:Transporter n=1 Tax=Alkalihalobacillus alcalophilus ATCC 27647 = CGMCC 1.3604 TaxID=1218173 RepID=J8TVJ1_ALKAL|nr:EamA family transporter RarD [Alkalihalobacillus alcalophilus]AFV25669.1 drug/putative metabolite transporter [Alkalihalobacillus alcalophilus ATCC 27647 = CGMCC 1.3604]KGA96162.1 transporter [Alkalihalobacillus alcalophilus ATCC 27647 = CGMCC 1.3604]MED1562036.1 EamA family transporter RarD [Alkalihalobacillus alcalophilus]THG89383.1 transporter [Alkalihalobacillus alcalophilus ATCC 27647 = CGMCC 1.3604]
MTEEQNQHRMGVMAGLGAYLLWGVFPIYWKFLDHIDPLVVLAHRVVWSLIFVLLVIIVSNQFKRTNQEIKAVFTNWRAGLGIILASFLISINWYVFIWAVSNEYVLQASLGYYINPLLNVLLAFLFLQERFNRKQITAFVLAFIGVLCMTFDYGSFPWVSLILATSFGLYGLIKKLVKVSSLVGLFIETLIVSPIAIIFLVQTPIGPALQVTNSTTWLLIGGGVATAIPLLLFATGAKRISLSLIGFLQYIAPTIMFILGVFVYKEPFNWVQLLAFGFIWSGLIVFTSASRKREIAHKVAS